MSSQLKIEEERSSETPPQEKVEGSFDSAADVPATIQLAVAADENFAMPMAVTLFSALHHLSSDQEVQVTALDAGVTEESKTRILDVVQRAHQAVHLDWVRPERIPFEDLDLQMDPRFSSAIFYRLFIPEIYPTTCDRVLYLDSDIVFERSLRSLWRSSLGDTALRAVPERIVSCPKAGIAEWERLGLDPGAPFFNSGLMLINLDVWRDQGLHKQAIEYLFDSDNDFCYASDQEALNAVLAGKWEALDHRWNVIEQVFDAELRSRHEVMLGTTLRYVCQEPFAIHYTSDMKPWLPGCAHPARDRFFTYLRQSGWFSPTEYLAWRASLSLRDRIHWAKEITRPLRHRVGLRRGQGTR